MCMFLIQEVCIQFEIEFNYRNVKRQTEAKLMTREMKCLYHAPWINR